MRTSARAAVVLVITVGLSVTAGPAYAGDLESCLRLWGEQYCRTHYTGRHIPTTGELRPAPAHKCPAKRAPCGFVDERGRSWA